MAKSFLSALSSTRLRPTAAGATGALEGSLGPGPGTRGHVPEFHVGRLPLNEGPECIHFSLDVAVDHLAVRHAEPRAPAAYVGPTLSGTDLGIEKAECAPSGYVILEEQASVGRFPGALAIARLVPADKVASAYDEPPPAGWRLGKTEDEKATFTIRISEG